VELSVDLRTTTNEALTERVRQYPVQASLLLYPLRTAFSPYLLGGGGWYTTRLETLVDDEAISTQSSREFGWHGGFGAELRLGSHAGAHADYRYTHLAYGDDDDDGDDEGALGKLMPSYRGSMWTAGLTIYF
jgi:opacity protein-like surface antigen